jgi:cysteine desulfurase/selenocysteine lyase
MEQNDTLSILMLDRNKITAAYPLIKRTTYLNTSSCGLVSLSGIEKADKFNKRLHAHGSNTFENFMLETLPQIRKSVCSFIDAPMHEVALIPNFSYALSAVIPAISCLKRVLLFKADYPSLIQPFLINDFEVSWMESHDGFTIDIEELKDIIVRNRIEILAISHVQWLAGFTIDIDELGQFCQLHDVIFILDGTQSLGAIPFSFKSSNINIYITSNYKWMNGGFGTGIMCIKEETMTKYPPKIGGFNSYKFMDEKWEYQPSIQSYEPGHLNMPGLIVLQDAIDFKMDLGVINIGTHNKNLLIKFLKAAESNSIDLIGPRGIDSRSNIVGIKGDDKLEKYLINRDIVVKMRNDIIRIGIHFHNTESDIDRLISSLKSYNPVQ